MIKKEVLITIILQQPFVGIRPSQCLQSSPVKLLLFCFSVEVDHASATEVLDEL